MVRITLPLTLFLFFWLVVLAISGESTPNQDVKKQFGKERYSSSGFQILEKGLNASERAGQKIWFYATAGNSRFHTYVFQQRVGVLIDWYKVLNSNKREQRFTTWGLINNPDCCKPGTQNCQARSLEETYGFDWCPGDDVLLSYVGKKGYSEHDPACHFEDAPISGNDVHGPEDQRQSSCDLEFGTSTGALGVQKFPNPRFNKEQWLKINGGKLGTWEGYNTPLSADENNSDSQVTRLSDGSIEPPFLIGLACGSRSLRRRAPRVVGEELLHHLRWRRRREERHDDQGKRRSRKNERHRHHSENQKGLAGRWIEHEIEQPEPAGRDGRDTGHRALPVASPPIESGNEKGEQAGETGEAPNAQIEDALRIRQSDQIGDHHHQ